MEMLTAKEVMESAVNSLDRKHARDIKVLRTADLTVVADYFVICTASTTSHIKTLTDEIEKNLEALGETVLRKEGSRAGGWVLLDYGCVIVHVFLEETREFYNLERLWSDAEAVNLSSLLGPC